MVSSGSRSTLERRLHSTSFWRRTGRPLLVTEADGKKLLVLPIENEIGTEIEMDWSNVVLIALVNARDEEDEWVLTVIWQSYRSRSEIEGVKRQRWLLFQTLIHGFRHDNGLHWVESGVVRRAVGLYRVMIRQPVSFAVHVNSQGWSNSRHDLRSPSSKALRFTKLTDHVKIERIGPCRGLARPFDSYVYVGLTFWSGEICRLPIICIIKGVCYSCLED